MTISTHPNLPLTLERVPKMKIIHFAYFVKISVAIGKLDEVIVLLFFALEQFPHFVKSHMSISTMIFII